jgi:drug/metabolite transporter (DMT)-like permease
LEFTSIRLLSGILVLFPLIILNERKLLIKSNQATERVDIFSFKWANVAPSLFLFSYALFFSLAYIQLDAGIGALILFASVQLTMMGISIYRGNRVAVVEWFGFVVAFGGLIYLLFPGLSSPAPLGMIMMVLSGISWGVYSLLGKNQSQPILSTARNFLFCLPGCLFLILIIIGIGANGGRFQVQSSGIVLAVLSGALASAGGYVLWYISLKRITTTVASIAQLSVPILAGIGGILFLQENINLRLILSSGLIIGGIIVTVVGKRQKK